MIRIGILLKIIYIGYKSIPSKNHARFLSRKKLFV